MNRTSHLDCKEISRRSGERKEKEKLHANIPVHVLIPCCIVVKKLLGKSLLYIKTFPQLRKKKHTQNQNNLFQVFVGGSTDAQP